jgi:conjugative transposon TraJ protein
MGKCEGATGGAANDVTVLTKLRNILKQKQRVMGKCERIVSSVAIGLLFFPFLAQAQVATDIHSLHSVLDQLYENMIPLCSQLIGVGRGLAGFAATWYIASRIWRHIANAEPVDFYPLFRPFVLGFAILIFPSVLAMMNGVLKPTVAGTAAMVTDSDKAIAALLQAKEDAIRQTIYWQMYVGNSGEGDQDKWYQYTYDEDPASESWVEGIGNAVRFSMSKLYYNFKNSIKEWLSEILKVLYEAAALCINTIRTFYLIVLAILGPLVFGIAIFDGFQHTLTMWIARYINIFLWLPVANIFGAILGKIQENMLRLDISQIQDQGDTFFSSTDIAYLVFMIIGIVGYFTVPSIANYIIHAGGGHALLHRSTTGFNTVTGTAISSGGNVVTSGLERIGAGATNLVDTPGYIAEGYRSGSNDGYMKDRIAPPDATRR